MTKFLRTITRITLVLMVAVPVLLSGCGGDEDDSSSGSKTTITISGAFALYPLVLQWADQYKADHSNVQFDISAGGAGKGMSDVLAGAVDIAMVSREVRPEEADQGAVTFAVAKDAVVATVNADNPVLDQLLAIGITPESGAAIWISGEVSTWGDLLGENDESEIHVYTRSDACGAAEVWSLYLGGTAQEDLQGIAVQGDPGLAEAVRKDSLGIGFNNLNFAYDPDSGEPVNGIRVVPIDLDGDGTISDEENFYADKTSLTAAIAAGQYPSPPSRSLYLVTKDQPNQAAADFIRWVLTDGQAYVSETGYVQLTDDLLQAGVDALGAE
ncbi:MAG: substrate-binding domain-containing protein [Anaerolineae bacterium]|nr:substrate-binding domain-containing protein [Anaerolineae bacterium]